MSLLKDRVKGEVVFCFFQEGHLYYECTHDGFLFSVPVEDTTNEQGDQPVFRAEDKGIYFMRWIRKAMTDGS